MSVSDLQSRSITDRQGQNHVIESYEHSMMERALFANMASFLAIIKHFVRLKTYFLFMQLIRFYDLLLGNLLITRVLLKSVTNVTCDMQGICAKNRITDDDKYVLRTCATVFLVLRDRSP